MIARLVGDVGGVHVYVIVAAGAAAEDVVLDDGLALKVQFQIVFLRCGIAALALCLIVGLHLGLTAGENIATARHNGGAGGVFPAVTTGRHHILCTRRKPV